MIYLPDTDTVNYLIKNIAVVHKHYQSAVRAGDSFLLSLMVDFQITRYHSLKNAANVHRLYTNLVVNWERTGIADTDWADAATLWADRHRLGRPIDDADLLIAITAKKCGAVLVTNNTRHFEGLGVSLANWTG